MKLLSKLRQRVGKNSSSEANDGPYKYTPLYDSLKIRILNLLPGSGDDVLRGSLEEVNLERSGIYEAISYCWGSDQKPYILQTTQGSIPITASLHSALIQFRSPKVVSRVWADAVCICQDDNVEKAVQVRLMNQIYSRAVCVLVYLGREADDGQRALGLLKQVSEIRENKDLVKSLLDLEENLKAIAAVFRRPWWSRIWIVQEFLNAKDVEIFIGNKSIRGSIFFDAMNEIAIHLYDYDVESQPGLRGFLALYHGRKLKRWPLLDLLELFSGFLATRARDHLFALLALASDADDKGFNPDYDSPFETIVRRYASLFVARGRTLDLLCRAYKDKLDERFPSWVPDWTVSTMPILTHGFLNNHGRYRAAGSSRLNAFYSQALDKLVTHGWQVDYVKQVTVTPHGPSKQYFKECQELINQLNSYPTGEHLREAMWKTLIAGRVDNGEVLTGKVLEKMQNAYFVFEKGMHLLPEEEYLTWDEQSEEGLVKYGNAFSTFNSEFHLATSRTGYICLVPSGTQADDCIFVLQGCPEPFILRQAGPESDKSFLFLGKTYVHGIMNGEVVENGKYDDQEIYLK
jgi:hypothetical protein